MAQGRIKQIDRMGYVLLLVFASACSLHVHTFGIEPQTSLLTQALLATDNEEYEKAINFYLGHMDQRLNDPRRPIDENPYFYYIRIGNLYLQMEKPAKALDSYLAALANGIRAATVADRLIAVAEFYEKQNRYDDALDMLQDYKELDSDRILLQIDRIYKKSLKSGQTAAETPKVDSGK